GALRAGDAEGNSMTGHMGRHTTDPKHCTWHVAALGGAAVLVLGMIASAGSFTSAATQGTRKVALVGGMLLDGYEVPPLHHAAILIEGDRIVWVGRAADVKIPSDATVIDTSGRVMLP